MTSIGKAQREIALCSPPPPSFPSSVGPPRQQQQQRHAESFAASTAGRHRSSDSTSTVTSTERPCVDLSKEGLARGERVPLTEAATGTGTAGAQNTWGWGHDVCRWRAQGGAVKAIVSADYSGDIKIFLGFVGDI